MKINSFFILIWLGFVDGEGSISIASVGKKKQAIVRITVVNTVQSIIEMFQEEFGGTIRKREWKNPKWKPSYEWRLTSDKAIEAIQKLVPFLKIKDKQAMLCLKLQEFRKSRIVHARWHKEEYQKTVDFIQSLKEECKKLNERGL